MDVEELVARHPRVFHTMSATAWPSVQRHGLLSTRQLIELFGLDATQKNQPMRGHRSWLPIADYPYDEYRRRHGRDGALVEVTVLEAVPDILDLTGRIEGAVEGARPARRRGDFVARPCR
ncbi:hypothetical protein [Actinoplanes sp. NPDC026619]|uniref:DUF7002 family protein n=1 Tax=Actinoplanes sp. NPDC026619 TaxID=3155798 RepID=UPI0033FC2B73